MENKKIAYILSMLVLVILTVFASSDEKHPNEYYVKKVIDGDTIELESGEKVRFIGINTPETNSPQKKNECFGREAKEYTKDLLEGEWITLQRDVSETDRFGRLLRYVYLKNELVNDKLVKQGYAYASSYPPDIHFQDVFSSSQNYARENNLGLWNKCKK